MVMTDPDSAVTMLGQLDVSAATASQKAHHALLLTKARHKVHIIETDDSLIRIASDYYRGSGDSLETQSLFYLGIVLGNKGDYSHSLVSLMEAEDCATSDGDGFYLGMASREQAQIYSNLLEYDRAVKYFNKAIESLTEFIVRYMQPGSGYIFLSLWSTHVRLTKRTILSRFLPRTV